MELAILAYNTLIAPLTLLSFLLRFLFKRDLARLDESLYWASRLGIYSGRQKRLLAGLPRPVVWMHAVSVGEVGVANILIEELKERFPRASIVLSVSTKHGLNFASKRISDAITLIPFPLDLPNVTRSVVETICPDVYVSLETEIWPNIITWLHRRSIPVLLLNGRISDRSFKTYQLSQWLWKPVLRKFSRLVMISEKHCEKVVTLGANPEKVRVGGNVKLAEALTPKDVKEKERWRSLLNISKDTPVFVCGSLREEENTWLLEVYETLRERHPELIGIFAPRHLKRISTLEKWLRNRKITYQKLSLILSGREKRKTSVILVDVIGELANLYSIASVAFCGGSLVPIGGHNILEPVTWGKPVFYGPYTDNFADIKEFVEESGLGFQAAGKDELPRMVNEALSQRGVFSKRRLPESKEHNLGAIAKNQVQYISEFLEK